MNHVIRILVDPFNSTISQPKLYDGRCDRSAGLKLRVTGELHCRTAEPTYISLIPGFSNNITYTNGEVLDDYPAPYSAHFGTEEDRNLIRQCRLVSVGLRLSLVNSAEQNEGYWEAIRIPYRDIWEVSDSDARINFPDEQLDTLFSHFADHATYQTGKLRDLHRVQFKLNSNTSDHEFQSNLNNQLLGPRSSTSTYVVSTQSVDHLSLSLNLRTLLRVSLRASYLYLQLHFFPPAIIFSIARILAFDQYVLRLG